MYKNMIFDINLYTVYNDKKYIIINNDKNMMHYLQWKQFLLPGLGIEPRPG